MVITKFGTDSIETPDNIFYTNRTQISQSATVPVGIETRYNTCSTNVFMDLTTLVVSYCHWNIINLQAAYVMNLIPIFPLNPLLTYFYANEDTFIFIKKLLL